MESLREKMHRKLRLELEETLTGYDVVEVMYDTYIDMIEPGYRDVQWAIEYHITGSLSPWM